MESRTARDSTEPPAIRFGSEDAPVASPPLTLEFAPRDLLVFWEDERADQYKRIVGLVSGNKLKLVKITVGRDNAMEVICEAALADDVMLGTTQFVTRDALLLWAEARPRGHGKTIVVRVGTALKLVRVTGDERTPAIEVLQSIDLGR